MLEKKYVTAVSGETFEVFAHNCEEALEKAKELYAKKHSEDTVSE